RQTVFTNLPLASVQEMTVLENAFSAEYGATTGGVVNIVTKTGSSDFHGEALELFRPSDTQAKLSGFTPANAPNGNAITDDSLMQTSASLGGPIGSSGRTHFFISGEYTWQNRTSPVISPVAPGPFEGHYRGWLAFARVDHQINERNSLIFRTQYIVPITGLGNFVSGTSQSAQLQNRQYEFSDTLSVSKGRHELRFGADVIHAHNGGNGKEFGGPSFLGAFTYKACGLGVTACESQAYIGDIANVSSYAQSYGNATYTVNDTLWALFAQDNFRIFPNLTLN